MWRTVIAYPVASWPAAGRPGDDAGHLALSQQHAPRTTGTRRIEDVANAAPDPPFSKLPHAVPVIIDGKPNAVFCVRSVPIRNGW